LNKDIIFEDNHLLVINKPAGALSQPDGSSAKDVLTFYKNYLKKRDKKPGNVFLGLVHRLDRPVGGVLVLAKTSKAAGRLSEQIRNRTVKKTYLVVVEGDTPVNALLEGYIKKDRKLNKVSVTNKPAHGAKIAQLTYIKLESYQNLSLLEVDLQTGRPHQIRAQMADSGYPVYGDQKYGKAKINKNPALFSHMFNLEHPTQKTRMNFKALPPAAEPWTFFPTLLRK